MSVEAVAPPRADVGVGDAASRLRSVFESGLTRDLGWRAAQLEALARMMVENEQAIADALAADLGKPFAEATTAEIDFVRKDALHARKHLKAWTRATKVSTPLAIQPGQSFIQPSSFGVALIIGAWNYPIQLTLAPLVAAIAAGNCAVLKPSELAPHSSALMAALVPRYLDPRAFAVIEGAAEISQKLLAQRFDLIFYTGGSRVGRIVMEAAAKHLTPVVLELGGKNPCIVDETADLEVAARRIAWGRYLNAGQICIAPDHVHVAASVEQAFLEQLKKAITTLFGTDPKASADFGRIVNARHTERLAGLMSGARVYLGGEVDVAARYVAPTVLTEVAADAPAMADEIFGPILPVLPYQRLDDALSRIRARDHALALYGFTKDDSAARRIIDETQSGSVVINDVVVFVANPGLPFGGVGASGLGAYHGRHGFDAFSQKRAVLKRGFAMDASVRYPPFNKGKLALLRRLA